MERQGFTIILGVILWAASFPAHAQTMPEGPGKSLVSMQCANCHALDVALSKRVTLDEWSTIVKMMIERGAPITDADAAIIAAYLGQHFGPGAPAPVPAQTGAAALPDLPGRDVLTSKCTQCHAMSMWTALRQDRKAWDSVLYRMVGRGALWTEDDIRAMAGYLARVRGPQ
jgi:cytochrome c5